MQRQTPMDTSIRGYVSGGARGLVHECDDKQQMQELKINFLHHETRKKVEHPQNYGFTSYCREADYDGGGGEEEDEGNIGGEEEKKIKKAAEHFAQFMGGSRNFPVVQNLDDRRFRCRNFDEGEVAMYDDQQQKVHIMRKRIYTRSPFKIEMRVIKEEKEEDGHGHDPKASRDQKKDESIRLSTVVMDKDWIVLERTKEKKGQQKQQKQQKQPGQDDDYQDDEPEEEYKKDPEIERYTRVEMGEKNITMTVFREDRPFLIFDMNEETSMIQMQTLREDQPNLQFTLDGENGEVSIGSVPQEGKPNLTFEMDDENRRIRIQIEKDDKPHLVFEHDGRNERSTWKTTQNDQDRLKIELDDRQETITITTDSNTRMQFNNKEKKIEMNTDNTRITMDENKKSIVMRGDSAYIKLDDQMARIGEENANIPAGMRGSIDTMGNRLIGALAKKVMVV